VKFFELKYWPEGDADTYFAQEDGHNVGDAEHCANCGAPISMLTWLPPFRVELKLHGKQFGDFAFGPGNDFLASQRFRQAYHLHGLTGFVGFDPVEVIKSRFSRRPQSHPPMYFRVHPVRGGATLDQQASEFQWDRPPTCPICKSGIVRRWKRLLLEPGTWTGEDVFRPRGLGGIVMVSQRFKEACESDGIKNAEFTPAEEAGHDFYPGQAGEGTSAH
jgi:hypothetical protein